MSLKLLKLHPNAVVPQMFGESAGLDLSSIEEVTIPERGRCLIRTGIAFSPPAGTYGRIAPRSGLAVSGIDTAGGVIDPDYTGEVKVILVNNTSVPFNVTRGMRIAQVVFEHFTPVSVIRIVDSLAPTSRGIGGFGSTGLD